MTYLIEGVPSEVDLGAIGDNEIIQNVRMILLTMKGSVPLDREFGVNFSVLDKPIPSTMARLRAELFQAIRKYEPRVKVVRIGFEHVESDVLNGRIIPVVEIEVRQ